MTPTVSKRAMLKLAGLATLAATAALMGCGKKEEGAPGGASAVSEPAASAAATSGPLKIAFAYVGPVGDGGWTFAHDNGPQGGHERVRRQGQRPASSRRCLRRPTPSA
jgi:basic membrane protein A